MQRLKAAIQVKPMVPSAPIKAEKKQSAPTPQTSSAQLVATDRVQKLQQDVADLRSLITIQGRQINALMLQQKHFQDELNNKSTMLKPTDSSPQDLSSDQSKATTSLVDQQEVTVYQSAYQLMRDRKYTQAIKQFNDYLNNYPNGASVVEAHYWLGELYAVAGDDDKAIKQFTLIVNQYPKSKKAPEAMLKLGSMANDQQQYTQAKSWWQKLVNQYPTTTAARIAKTQLQHY